MSKSQKKIGLIATKIKFNNFSIIYTVKPEIEIDNLCHQVVCSNDIKNKDLILKPTIIDNESSDVVFTPSNVTPHFYQSIFSGRIRHWEEYESNKNDIYLVGEIVGYIII